MNVIRGSNATFSAEFVTSTGVLIDPTGLVVDIIGSNNVIRVNDAIPTKLSLGFYQFVYAVPIGETLGTWRIEWASPSQFFGAEEFKVVSADVVAFFGTTSDLIMQLRRRLGEVSRLPAGNNASDTMFTDGDLRKVLDFVDNDIDKASLEGWLYKEAYYAKMVDMNEHGSDRKLSQLWKQAQVMVNQYAKVVGDEAEALRAGFRVVGRAMDLAREEESLQTPFSGYSDHVRVYPQKRFLVPAVM